MNTTYFSVPKTRWKRAGAVGKRKTKGGCITCKARRVKCDETKPHCFRCRRLDRHCEGYAEPAPTKPRKAPAPIQHLRSIRPLNSIQPSHELVDLNEMDGLYFHNFKAFIVPELCTGYSTNLWRRIVLQACHGDKLTRQIVVAIGALGAVRKFAMHKHEHKSELLAIKREQTSWHYENALRKYGLALNSLRQVLSSERQEIRQLLITCLLVVLFEGFQGNLDAVIIHADIGCTMLRDWKAEMQPHSAIMAQPKMKIEDDIVQAFGRMDMHVTSAKWLRGDISSASSFGTFRSNPTQHIPSAYTSIDEAYQGFESVQTDNIQLLYSVAVVLKDETDIKARKQGHKPDHPSDQTLEKLRRETDPMVRETKILVKVKNQVSVIKAWLKSAQSLRSHLTDDSKRDLMALEISQLGMQILLASTGFKDEVLMDVFMPEFKQMVALAGASGSRQPSMIGMFFMDHGILPSLFVVVKGCRDPQVRREAIKILFSTPRREGIWDNLFVARFGMWIMQEEEKGMVDGYIPDWSRIYVTKAEVDTETKTATVEGVSKGTNRDLGNTKQAVIDWGQPMTPEESLELAWDLETSR
ncbi:hypothetical protein B0O99DRAFT_633233 [Bisporella sp. PMI_857]|nr:hypothetical protein B0O99DRAFT_633233 [Bisporella sp. PMI_857]